MLRRTRLKLAEAHFFIAQVRKHYHDVLSTGTLEVRPLVHYVSAFASAARSVTWIMRAECDAIPGWAEWYKRQLVSDRDKLTLRAFTDIRNRSQKAEPLALQVRMYAGDPEKPLRGSSNLPLAKQYKVTLVEVTAEGDPIGGAVTTRLETIEFGLPELDDRDLYLACQEYLALLDRLVATCESTFAAELHDATDVQDATDG